MAVIFAKLAPNVRRHPKCRDAGRDGTDVFIHALCVNAERGATGVVPAIYMRARFIREEVQFDSEKQAADAIAAAVAADLIELLPDGSALIVGWDEEEWGRSRDAESMTEADRKKVQRQKAREQKRADAARNAPDVRTCPDASRHVSGRPDHVEEEEESDVESEEEVPAAPVVDPPKPKPRKQPTGDHAALIAAFDAAYQAQTGTAPTWGGKQGAIAKRLLAAHSLADCLDRLARLFAGHLSWLSTPYSIGDLEQHFDKLAPVVNGQRAGPARPAQPQLRGMSAALAASERFDRSLDE